MSFNHPIQCAASVAMIPKCVEDMLPPSDSIADSTWRKGFLHLTIDGDGLVSLWDHEMDVVSYVKLQLTPEQVRVIEETMRKDGPTP